MTPELTIVPANEASWEDLQAVLGTRGDPSRCQCQRYKMQHRESWASVGAEELAFRFRTQTDCGHRKAGTTSGLVAYLDGEPVGWCAVEPRTAYPRLLLKTRVPWEGRAEDKTDDSVWAVTCFVTRAGFRRRGVSRALARAAVDFARERGARALEGYPMVTQPREKVTLLSELHVGSRSIFAAAGFSEVGRPTIRRAVMRIDFFERLRVVVGDLVAFIGVVAVIVVLPGPDMALVLQNGLARGRRAAVETALGINAGLLVWAVAAALGIAALLHASAPAFTLLKLAGAAYLVWLGLRALHEAWRGTPDASAEHPARRKTSPFRQGLLSNLLNPKIALVFTTLIPQFVDAGGPAVAQTLLFAAIFIAMGLVWLTSYALLVARVGARLEALRRPARAERRHRDGADRARRATGPRAPLGLASSRCYRLLLSAHSACRREGWRRTFPWSSRCRAVRATATRLSLHGRLRATTRRTPRSSGRTSASPTAWRPPSPAGTSTRRRRFRTPT